MDLVTQDMSETVEAVDGVFLTQLAAGDRMSIQHVRIEPGARVPEHDHHHEQLGFVYRGVQTFVIGGETIDVTPGDSYAIPGGEPHAAENHGEEAMEAIDVFSPPRPNPDWSQ